jgi:hypothetical protein
MEIRIIEVSDKLKTSSDINIFNRTSWEFFLGNNAIALLAPISAPAVWAADALELGMSAGEFVLGEVLWTGYRVSISGTASTYTPVDIVSILENLDTEIRKKACCSCQKREDNIFAKRFCELEERDLDSDWYNSNCVTKKRPANPSAIQTLQ